MKIRVLGTGSWGSALAQTLADNGHDVIMWGIDDAEINDIENNHHNTKYFDVEMNHDVHATKDITCVKDADVILVAVPSGALDSVLRQVTDLTEKKIIIINVAKGFHPETHQRLSEVIKDLVPEDKREAVVSFDWAISRRRSYPSSIDMLKCCQ